MEDVVVGSPRRQIAWRPELSPAMCKSLSGDTESLDPGPRSVLLDFPSLPLLSGALLVGQA